MHAPNTEEVLGLRDRTMLELMYASGLRVSEIVSLKTVSLGLNEGIVRVVNGKGGKERLVPFGVEAGLWLRKYLHEARPLLLEGKNCQEVFVGRHTGTGLTRQAFWVFIKRYAQIAGIKVALSPHTLRHAFATLLALAIAYPLAYAIAFKSGKYRNILLVMVVAPFFTSFLLRTIAWTQIFGLQRFDITQHLML